MTAWKTASERGSSDDEIRRLILETFRLHGAVFAAENALASEFGLTSARWQVLGAVWDTDRTLSGIARSMGLTRQSVQRTTLRLVADGFVELRDNPDHARAKLVSLTEKGADTLQKISEKQAQWVSSLAEDMEPANIRIAVGMMRGLLNRLSTLEAGE